MSPVVARCALLDDRSAPLPGRGLEEFCRRNGLDRIRIGQIGQGGDRNGAVLLFVPRVTDGIRK
jgi:hypothetical protein